ncbi:hypothetical protein BSKO_00859 [Bryopsis sp. KO-2023]|nr:hypothetical protein BSKO_00859 [Bryopsis sp. KO-2023]
MGVTKITPLATHKPWMPVGRTPSLSIKHTAPRTRRRALSTDTVDELELDESICVDDCDLSKREGGVTSTSTEQVRNKLEDLAKVSAIKRSGEFENNVVQKCGDFPVVHGAVPAVEKVDVGEEEEEADRKLEGSLKGMLMLNLGAALFGSNQVVIKTTESSVSPGALSALRFIIAAAFFAPDMLKGLKDKELRNGAVELGFWLFGGYTAQAIGLFSTTAARGAFTGTFTVLAVPILVGLSGRRVPPTTWIAAMIAIGGVGLLTTSGTEANVGDLWCILSAILFGVHKWRSEGTTAKFPDQTKELVGLQIWVIMLMSCVYCAPELIGNIQQNGINGVIAGAMGLPWLALAFMGLGTTGLTLLIEMEALKEVSAPLAALIYTAEPLWGALFAYYALGERWGPMGWVGAALIVSSSLLAQFSGDEGSKQKPKEA